MDGRELCLRSDAGIHNSTTTISCPIILLKPDDGAPISSQFRPPKLHYDAIRPSHKTDSRTQVYDYVFVSSCSFALSFFKSSCRHLSFRPRSTPSIANIKKVQTPRNIRLMGKPEKLLAFEIHSLDPMTMVDSVPI